MFISFFARSQSKYYASLLISIFMEGDAISTSKKQHKCYKCKKSMNLTINSRMKTIKCQTSSLSMLDSMIISDLIHLIITHCTDKVKAIKFPSLIVQMLELIKSQPRYCKVQKTESSKKKNKSETK